jgi:hypothetical protein
LFGWELGVEMTDGHEADCSHESTVNGVTGGVGSVLCEDCGDVIVSDEAMVSRDIDRSMFFRKADSVERAKAPSETLKSQH